MFIRQRTVTIKINKFKSNKKYYKESFAKWIVFIFNIITINENKILKDEIKLNTKNKSKSN